MKGPRVKRKRKQRKIAHGQSVFPPYHPPRLPKERKRETASSPGVSKGKKIHCWKKKEKKKETRNIIPQRTRESRGGGEKKGKEKKKVQRAYLLQITFSIFRFL